MCSYSEDEVVSLCHNPTLVLSSPRCSNKVVRISEHLAVKFGEFVTVQEFRNQRIAQQHLASDSTIVTVPRAHCYFKKDKIGYLVMDYIVGKTLDLRVAKDMVEVLGRAFNELHQQRGTKPGSLGGGVMIGQLWPEHEEVEFFGLDNLQLWFNRSRSPERQIDFSQFPLCICHLDFNPRNIMVEGKRIYLIDWAAAGIFPRYFDYLVYQFLPQDAGFFGIIRPFIDALSDAEEETARAVVEVLQYRQFHVFSEAKVAQNARIGA